MTKAGADTIVISGGFDDLKPIHFRFFNESAKLGKVHALLWSDDSIKQVTCKPPKFSQDERLYTLEAIRYIHKVTLVNEVNPDALPDSLEFQPRMWVVDDTNDNPQKKAYCKANGLEYRVLRQKDVCRFPDYSPALLKRHSSRKKVIVTGCYDWFHSGHVRFFEEVSELGDLYVTVGSDENIRELKGDGHPMFPQQQRWFVVQSIRYVTQALIATGNGWLDAEPEIYRIKPDIYAVNEDGDRPEKRKFCRENGIEYVVLKRLPKPGLPQRKSAILRGF
jgi:cytidyltransferase-like protein